MNIFWLDSDPKLAAQMQCNKHVVKMTLETAQILCHVQHVAGGRSDLIPYRPLSKGHHKHPSVQWVLESKENYQWLLLHGFHLATEYYRRYGKVHACKNVFMHESIMSSPPGLPSIGLTPIKLAIKSGVYDDKIDRSDPVRAYRQYYVLDKARFAKWTHREPPDWWDALCKELLP